MGHGSMWGQRETRENQVSFHHVGFGDELKSLHLIIGAFHSLSQLTGSSIHTS